MYSAVFGFYLCTNCLCASSLLHNIPLHEYTTTYILVLLLETFGFLVCSYAKYNDTVNILFFFFFDDNTDLSLSG